MANYTPILKEMELEIATLAQAMVTKYKQEAIEDGRKMLLTIKDDLVRWMALLNQGDLKTAEFEWLINSDKELVKMTALKRAGLAQIRAEQFGVGVLNVIANTAINALAKEPAVA
ncbi:hypothetical protein EXU57_01645 [Segetibacter sp. 3557_3]|uniref:hypothetical protein n=1 Tax=Segetibacter sp. 3557_3 TaxID=2547429 RepID=UPI001058B3F8|nr:hypothetical protein [Segetibacter sp. 3557_3]TDH28800.1 hypothetical protein EXU57_01645 [Segetibacter sp. 3557_3]